MVLFAVGISFAALGVLADSTQVQYQVSNVTGNEWSYTYDIVTSTPFVANEALTVFFPVALYSSLDNLPASPTGWFAFSIQPDPILLTDGFYSAVALGDGASLAGPFTISFDYSGAGTPGSQDFSIDLFDNNGNYVQQCEHGSHYSLQHTSTGTRHGPSAACGRGCCQRT